MPPAGTATALDHLAELVKDATRRGDLATALRLVEAFRLSVPATGGQIVDLRDVRSRRHS